MNSNVVSKSTNRGVIAMLVGLTIAMIILQPFRDALLLNTPSGFFALGSFTGHFVHLNWIHLVLNAAALLLLPFVFSSVSKGHLIFLLLGCPLLVSVLIFELQTAFPVGQYVGLSGVLHGLFIGVPLLALLSKRFDRIDLLLMVLLVGKVAFESVSHDSMTAGLIGGNVYSAAHWMGILSGVALTLLWWAVNTWAVKPRAI